MKQIYFLGLDAAKHKIRVALSDRQEHVLFEKDLPVHATGLSELLQRFIGYPAVIHGRAERFSTDGGGRV